MRILILTAGLVALAGTAFAGEPQSSTNVQQPIVASAQKQIPAASLRAPRKMNDRQLEKIVAGSSNDGWVVSNNGGHIFCVNTHAAGGQVQGGGNSTVLMDICL